MSFVMDWYYKTADAEYGPLSLEELQFLKNRGQLSTGDFVRRGKQGAWRCAGAMSELFPASIVRRAEVRLGERLDSRRRAAKTDAVSTTASSSTMAADVPALNSLNRPSVPPSLPRDPAALRRKRIATATAVGLAVVLLVLLLVWMFLPKQTTTGVGTETSLASTEIGGENEQTPEGSGDGTTPTDESAGDAEETGDANTDSETPTEEAASNVVAQAVTGNEELPQPAPSEPSPSRPEERPSEPDVLLVERIPNAPSAQENRSNAGSGRGSGDFNERLKREGAQGGDVQVSLLWNNTNDLDLHVIGPSGERISYQNKRSSDGGELDVDMNVRGESRKPVENIFWPQGKAPRGLYRVFVHHYKNNGSRDPTRFSVRIKVNGKTKTFRGQVRAHTPPQLVHTFQR